jgi:hypothetical protein
VTVIHHVRAHNAATQSENEIHHDDVARTYGFQGGLVPGVTVYAYMTHPVVETFGRPWLEHGRWLPGSCGCYDGDEVTVDAVLEDDALELTARRAGTR